jgi:geranylgeranyl diphosphate synthase type I
MEKNFDLLWDFLKKVDNDITNNIFKVLDESNIAPDSLRLGVKAYFDRPSKKIRPGLVFLSGMHFGGEEIYSKLISAATAVECFHTWTLVHDDIIDQDEKRRGKDTAHIAIAKYYKNLNLGIKNCEKLGTDMAILVGDIQQGIAVNELIKSIEFGFSPKLIISLINKMENDLKIKLIEGEAIDVELSELRLSDCLDKDKIYKMMAYKTGELLKYAVYVGMVLGNNTLELDNEMNALLNAVEKMSLAFQLQDDILGIVGDEKKLGKPVGSDLREHKKTLLLIESYKSLSKVDQDKFINLFEKDNKNEIDYKEMHDMIVKSGGIEKIKSVSESLLKEAMDLIDLLRETEQKVYLKNLLEYMYKREW